MGPWPGWGGGGTDSLSLGTNCETTAPLFGQRAAPILLPPHLTPPLLIDAQEQPMETLNDKFSISNILYFTLLLFQEGLRTNLNACNRYLI